MKLFGLTGGIACGKSAVAARFRARGLPVIDADGLARDAVAPGTAGLAAVIDRFGRSVLNDRGELDRKALAAIVFHDESKRRELNGLVHPIVTALTGSRAKALADEGHPLACYEAALIVENGLADAFRPLVVVTAPQHLQTARACARDAASVQDVEARIASQLPMAAKEKAADFVICNEGSLEELRARADEVLDSICKLQGISEARYPVPPHEQPRSENVS